MKCILNICIFMVFSCSPSFEKNKSFPIIIINVDSETNDAGKLNKSKISNVINKLQDVPLAALVFKPVFKEYKLADSIFLNILNNRPYPLYSSSSIDLESGRLDLNEDDYFSRVDLNISPSYRRIKVPAKEYVAVFKGIGPENVMFRNSGKIESYYFIKSVNGKSYASLPLKLASDLTGISLDKKRMEALKLSKYGSLALAFSESGEYTKYEYYDFMNNELNYKLFKRAIVILAYGNVRHFTNGGIKSNAEITADAINQALVRLSKSVSQSL